MYQEGNLNGIFVEIHSESTADYSEESLEQLAVAFLTNHQLASEVSLVEKKMRENEQEMIFRLALLDENVVFNLSSASIKEYL